MAASLDRAKFLMKMLKFMTTAQEFGGSYLAIFALRELLCL